MNKAESDKLRNQQRNNTPDVVTICSASYNADWLGSNAPVHDRLRELTVRRDLLFAIGTYLNNFQRT